MKLRVYTGGSVIETTPETYFANLNVVNLHGISRMKAFCKDRKFIFKYMYVKGRWRAYVLRQPNTKEREWNTFIAHLDPDWGNYCDGCLHVDFDVPIKDLPEMQKVAHIWADLCFRYIETGTRIGIPLSE